VGRGINRECCEGVVNFSWIVLIFTFSLFLKYEKLSIWD
jgi:hypothetical protein